MKQYTLDTDMLTLCQESHAKVSSHVNQHSKQELTITVISVEEQLSGTRRHIGHAKSSGLPPGSRAGH